MDIGDHQVPARAQDASELGHHRCQRRNVDPRQGADKNASWKQRRPRTRQGTAFGYARVQGKKLLIPA
jgi:hypothetical protein